MSEHAPGRVLVTGGAGFIGSNLVHQLLRRDPELRVVVLDRMTYAASPANLRGVGEEPRFRLVVGDVCDAAVVEELLRVERIDTVVHLAAESHVDRSIAGPLPFVRTNVLGTATLLDRCAAVWSELRGREMAGCRFHHVGTDEVYGDLGPEDPPFTEASPYAPSSPYSASKAGADHLVRAWVRTYGLPATLTSCSNNYGPRQHAEKLVPVVVRACLERAPIPVYGTGDNVRDWLFVVDHCRALELVLRRGRPGETYAVGAGDEWRNLDLVGEICEAVASATGEAGEDLRALVRLVPDRPGHDRRYALDATKLRALGWAPRVGLREGLARTVAWYLEHGFDTVVGGQGVVGGGSAGHEGEGR